MQKVREKMDYNKLADLIFPDITGTVDELENRFPKRELPEGAKVTRFAPSPTGYMHIGGLYAAMISRKLAKQSGGVFYLRIEDTDRKRELSDGVNEIINSLNKFDLGFDEGPFPGGETIYGPYKQSERKEIYQICVKALMKAGYAYPDFTTAEELDEIRAKQEAEKLDIGYYGEFAKGRKLSYEEIEQKIANGETYVVRLKSPGSSEKTVIYSDPIRGKIEMPENIMDIVLLKSDGIPTYHFAHVVDDHFMRTNLVIRGDEWLASYPLHKQLFDLCGFELPKYAHIAPIMKLEVTVDEEGEHQRKRKLSKRKDPEAAVGFYAEQGFPAVSVLEYLMTIANSNYEEWHMAHSDKTIEDFNLSLKKMPVSGALFDMVKLNDVSKEMISRLTNEQCYDLIMDWAKEYAEPIYEFGTSDREAFLKTIGLWKASGKKVRKDVGKWSDLQDMFGYLYTPEDKLELEYEIDDKYTKENINEVISLYKQDLFLDSEDWFGYMKAMGETIGYCPNVKEYKNNPEGYKGSITDVCTIVRVAITGKQNSPDLFTIMNVIGKENTLKRLDKFLEHVNA
jgi:glutamyl-tRNA synthetase